MKLKNAEQILKDDPQDADAQALVDKFRKEVESAKPAKAEPKSLPASQLHQQKEKLERDIERTEGFVYRTQDKLAKMREKLVDALEENENRKDQIEELKEEIRKQFLPAQVPAPAPPPPPPPPQPLGVESLSAFVQSLKGQHQEALSNTHVDNETKLAINEFGSKFEMLNDIIGQMSKIQFAVSSNINLAAVQLGVTEGGGVMRTNVAAEEGNAAAAAAAGPIEPRTPERTTSMYAIATPTPMPPPNDQITGVEEAIDEFVADEETETMDQDPKKAEKRKSPNQAEFDQLTEEARVQRAARKGAGKAAKTSDATHSCCA